jgi:hypothetical protein
MQKKEVEKCKIECYYKDGSNNENGPEGLKKENFNVSEEEFNNIKNMFL